LLIGQGLASTGTEQRRKGSSSEFITRLCILFHFQMLCASFRVCGVESIGLWNHGFSEPTCSSCRFSPHLFFSSSGRFVLVLWHVKWIWIIHTGLMRQPCESYTHILQQSPLHVLFF
jgi:hypothetical protein